MVTCCWSPPPRRSLPEKRPDELDPSQRAARGEGLGRRRRRRCRRRRRLRHPAKRFHPEARILLVERSERFPPKVGEATVEVSAFFLSQVLDQQERFECEQLPKHGLRFWFTDGPGRRLGEMSEVGARVLSRVPTFQLDRITCDEGVLATAVEAGCGLLRPARVTRWEEGWPESRLEVKGDDGSHHVLKTRWLIDASGRQAFVARRKKLLTVTESHPVASVWDHWEGVADIDEPGFLAANDLPPNQHARRLEGEVREHRRPRGGQTRHRLKESIDVAHARFADEERKRSEHRQRQPHAGGDQKGLLQGQPVIDAVGRRERE